MLLTSKNFVTVPKQTTRAIEVNVPVNPASFINVQPLDEELLDGALPVVYRHKTQQKDKSLIIVYANLSDKDVIISPNQLIAHGSMISENKTKPAINIVNKGVKDPAVTDRLWAELKLNENKILQENVTVKNMVYSMINENQDIFTTEDCKVGKTTWEKFKIELIPNARPVNQRMRPIPPNLKENLRAQLDLWLKNEVIEPSSSPWSSPLVPVTKKSGETRWVLDFRRVNDLTVTDSFPTPNISEILTSLGKSRYFSTLDASQAYHTIEVEESSRPITAFATTFGLYQFFAYALRVT